jgi:hypothetical protein
VNASVSQARDCRDHRPPVEPTHGVEDSRRGGYPRFPRALFGVDKLAESFGEDGLVPEFDVEPVRRAVAEMMASLKNRQ